MTEQDKLIAAIKMLLRVIFSYREGSMTQEEFFNWCDGLEKEILSNITVEKN